MRLIYPELFEPIHIGGVEIKNRFMLAPMGPAGLCDQEGGFNQRGVEFYVTRAQGGTGLIMPGVTKVENDIEQCHLPSMPCPTLNPSHFIQSTRPMNERIHAYNARCFLQLSAGFGRVGLPHIVKSLPVAPSAIPHRWVKGLTCRALTIDEIHTYVQKFAQSASIAQKAGFDGVEIHAVHEGYLLDQFAISFFNHRNDQYGGSLNNRLRFAIEIVQAIKHQCGNDFPVSLRYSLKSFIKNWCEGGLPGESFTEQGRDIKEGIQAAKLLETAGYDAFNVDVGSYDSWYWSHPPMYQSKELYLPYAGILKEHLHVPIICAGRMDNPERAAIAIREGKTDIIGLARPLLADAELPKKIMHQQMDQIRPCISCQEGCMGRLEHYMQLGCSVNPQACREQEYLLTPTCHPKKIVIVGGGMAGMEAARVAAIRGHHVTLFEATKQLGGMVIAGGVPDFKEDDHQLIKWYQRQLEQLPVTLKMETKATYETIINHQADVVIIATGSQAKPFSTKGNMPILAATDVLLGLEKTGPRVAIVGGGLVGCELALWLAQNEQQVSLIEQENTCLKTNGPLCDANHDMLLDLLNAQQVNIQTEHQLVSADNSIICCRNIATDQIEEIQADSIISAIGYQSDNQLYQQLRTDIADLYLIGDARQVQNIMYAIWDGFEVARTC
ncbi:MAG: Cinnamate reductase [Candidatus Celerinatantimonas neptuna]|nr:MAG: Cinnamate reductase [Candidatus Celerinatantimonas neptuna]